MSYVDRFRSSCVCRKLLIPVNCYRFKLSPKSCVFLSADTERALQVMEACQAGAAEGVKGHAEKLLNIFQSDLFQALLGKIHTLACYHGNSSPQSDVHALSRSSSNFFVPKSCVLDQPSAVCGNNNEYIDGNNIMI